MFQFYIAKATSAFGVTSTREVYERAIEVLPDQQCKEMCLEYAEMERKLGEIDRARSIYGHASQFCDPSVRGLLDSSNILRQTLHFGKFGTILKFNMATKIHLKKCFVSSALFRLNLIPRYSFSFVDVLICRLIIYLPKFYPQKASLLNPAILAWLGLLKALRASKLPAPQNPLPAPQPEIILMSLLFDTSHSHQPTINILACCHDFVFLGCWLICPVYSFNKYKGFISLPIKSYFKLSW